MSETLNIAGQTTSAELTEIYSAYGGDMAALSADIAAGTSTHDYDIIDLINAYTHFTGYIDATIIAASGDVYPLDDEDFWGDVIVSLKWWAEQNPDLTEIVETALANIETNTGLDPDSLEYEVAQFIEENSGTESGSDSDTETTTDGEDTLEFYIGNFADYNELSAYVLENFGLQQLISVSSLWLLDRTKEAYSSLNDLYSETLNEYNSIIEEYASVDPEDEDAQQQMFEISARKDRLTDILSSIRTDMEDLNESMSSWFQMEASINNDNANVIESILGYIAN